MLYKTSLLLLSSSLAFADVNMRDGSFLKTENDLDLPGIQRTYNSRSLWRGIFGFGWCSDLEKSLQSLSLKTGILKSCDQSQKVEIISTSNSRIYLDKRKTKYIFNLQGQLVKIQSAEGLSASLHYQNSPKPTHLIAQGIVLRLTYDSSARIAKIEGPKPLFYQYTSEGLLKNVSGGSGQKINYSYDSRFNLVGIDNGHLSEKIMYQSERDEVKFHQAMDGCFSLYQFKKVSEGELQSLITRRCPSSKSIQKTYRFLSQRSSNGQLTLLKVLTAGGSHDSQSLP